MARATGHYYSLLHLLRVSETPLLQQKEKRIYQPASPYGPLLGRLNTLWIKAGVHTRTGGGGEFALALLASPPVWLIQDEKKPALGGPLSLVR